jgi:hypothetical protein
MPSPDIVYTFAQMLDVRAAVLADKATLDTFRADLEGTVRDRSCLLAPEREGREPRRGGGGEGGSARRRGRDGRDLGSFRTTGLGATVAEENLMADGSTLLKVAAQPWKPSKKGDDTAESEASYKQLFADVNKLTEETIDTVGERIVDLVVATPSLRDEIITMLLDITQRNAFYSTLYAYVCSRIAFALPDETDIRAFIGELRKGCQVAFSEGVKGPQPAAKKEGEEEEAEAEAREETPEEADERHGLWKRSFIGLVTFIGELFLNELLSEKIIHVIIGTMLRATDETGKVSASHVDAACSLLTHIGKELDTNPKDEITSAYMQRYFDIFASWRKSSDLPSRSRFGLADLMDLRGDGWTVNHIGGRTKIFQVTGKPRKAADAGGWETVPTTGRQPAARLINPAAPSSSAAAAPSPAPAPAPAAGGGFSALADSDDEEEEEAEAEEGPALTRAPLTREKLKELSRSAFSEYVSLQATGTAAAEVVSVVREDILAASDASADATMVTFLNNIIDKASNASTAATDFVHLPSMIVDLAAADLLTPAVFWDAMCDYMEFFSDMLIDIPRLHVYFGSLFAGLEAGGFARLADLEGKYGSFLATMAEGSAAKDLAVETISQLKAKDAEKAAAAAGALDTAKWGEGAADAIAAALA